MNCYFELTFSLPSPSLLKLPVVLALRVLKVLRYTNVHVSLKSKGGFETNISGNKINVGGERRVSIVVRGGPACLSPLWQRFHHHALCQNLCQFLGSGQRNSISKAGIEQASVTPIPSATH